MSTLPHAGDLIIMKQHLNWDEVEVWGGTLSDSVRDLQSNQKNVAETLLSSAILEAIPDAVAAVNQQGVIIQVNSQAEAMFGYTRDELIGQKIEMLVPERHRPQHDTHRDHFHQQPEVAIHGGARRTGYCHERAFQVYSSDAHSTH